MDHGIEQIQGLSTVSTLTVAPSSYNTSNMSRTPSSRLLEALCGSSNMTDVWTQVAESGSVRICDLHEFTKEYTHFILAGTLVGTSGNLGGAPTTMWDRLSEVCRKFNLRSGNDQACLRFKHLCLRCRKSRPKSANCGEWASRWSEQWRVPAQVNTPSTPRDSSENCRLKPCFSAPLPQIFHLNASFPKPQAAICQPTAASVLTECIFLVRSMQRSFPSHRWHKTIYRFEAEGRSRPMTLKTHYEGPRQGTQTRPNIQIAPPLD
jgi:hypothetical protein